MNGVELASRRTQAAADTLVLIYDRRTAPEASGRLRLHLLLCKCRTQVAETLFCNARFLSRDLAFCVVELFYYGTVLIQLNELPQVASQSQGMPLMDKAVDGLAALFSGRDGIDGKFRSCIHVTAHKDVRFFRLICYRICFCRTVGVEFYRRIFQQFSPADGLSDGEEHILALHCDAVVFVIYRFKFPFRIKHRNAFLQDNPLYLSIICKNLFLCNRQETQFYLLMMPGDKKFKTKDLSAQLGVARLSFASEKYMQEYLDITPGSVSVMGLLNDRQGKVQLVIDEEVLRDQEIGCHPCVNTSSIKFKIKDLMETIIPAMNHEPVIVQLPRYEE